MLAILSDHCVAIGYIIDYCTGTYVIYKKFSTLFMLWTPTNHRLQYNHLTLLYSSLCHRHFPGWVADSIAPSLNSS